MKKGDKKDQEKLSTRKKVLIGIAVGLVILVVLGIVFYFVFRPDDGGSGGGGNTEPPVTLGPLNPAYCIVKVGQEVNTGVVDGGFQSMSRLGNVSFPRNKPNTITIWLAFLDDLLGSISNVELPDITEFSFNITNERILTERELIACVEYAKELEPTVIFGYQGLYQGANNVRIARDRIGYVGGIMPLTDTTIPSPYITTVIPKTGTNPEYC